MAPPPALVLGPGPAGRPASVGRRRAAPPKGFVLGCRNLKSAERAYGETSSPQACRASRGDLHPLRPRGGRGRLGGAARQRCGRGVDERSAGRAAHGDAAGGAPGRPAPAATAGARPRRPTRRRRTYRRGAATADAATIDPGMRFTMVGVTCAPPARDRRGRRCCCAPATTGRPGAAGTPSTLERGGRGRRGRAGPSPSPSGPATAATCRWPRSAPATPSRRPSACATCNVVAINSTEDADRASAVVGVVRRAAATVAGLHLTPPRPP